MTALFHLDAHVILKHCPQVLYASSSNVYFQGWFPLCIHFLGGLPCLTHSDNLMNWNTIVFRSSILHYTFVLKTVFELRVCQKSHPKECECCYKVSLSEAGGSCHWHAVKQAPWAARQHGPWVSSSDNTKYGNPLMCKITGTHAASESPRERKYFFFHVYLEGNPDRTLKLGCEFLCVFVCVCLYWNLDYDIIHMDFFCEEKHTQIESWNVRS